MKNKRLHKLLVILLAGCMAFGIAGCSQSTSPGGGSSSDDADNVTGEVSEGETEEETQVDPKIQAKIDAAQECVGKSVDELRSVCGEPNNTEYEDSPSPEGGKIGYYYYDGFTASTKVASDGSETVDGIW